MKYSQILIGGVLLALLLFLAACSSQPTQTPVVNDTPQNLGTGQEPVIETPVVEVPTQEPVVTTPPAIDFDNLSVPKVSVTSIDVFGSRYSAKYIFNQIVVNVTSDMPLDWDLLSIYVGNKYYNGTLSYNNNISCEKSADVIKNRNKKFAVDGTTTSGSICLSPARDMGTPETLSLVGTYDGNVLINETIKIPSSVTSPILHLK